MLSVSTSYGFTKLTHPSVHPHVYLSTQVYHPEGFYNDESSEATAGLCHLLLLSPSLSAIGPLGCQRGFRESLIGQLGGFYFLLVNNLLSVVCERCGFASIFFLFYCQISLDICCGTGSNCAQISGMIANLPSLFRDEQENQHII